MPLTPLHYAVAYAMRKAGKKAGLELDMPSLAMGSFTPDLETLVLIIIDKLGYLPSNAPYAQCHRLVLHSIFGSLTVGSLITMLMAMALYRLMAPEGTETPGLKDLYVASALGNLSHVLLDAVHHTYNPLLFPFTTANVLALVPFRHSSLGLTISYWFEQVARLPRGCGSFFLSGLLVYSVVVPANIYIIVRERDAGRRIIIRLLFEV